jgi:hypothetical protein
MATVEEQIKNTGDYQSPLKDKGHASTQDTLLKAMQKTAADPAAGAGPVWKKWTIADAGTIKDIAETAKELAENISTTSELATTAMKVVKVISELQSANPFLKALELLADETIAAIQDLKNAGFYYLYVDPYYKKNVAPKSVDTFGFEQLRDTSGRELFWNPNHADPESTTIHKDGVPPSKQPLYEAKIAMPRKLVAGGWNPYFRTWGEPDPFLKITPFPQYSATEVLKTMAEAFTDEGDVPRYKTNQGNGVAKGQIVYDEDGTSFSGWDPKEMEYPLALFDMGKDGGQEGDHKTDFLKNGGWRSERVPLNTMLWSGKPNIKGSSLDGTGSSAIVMIIAAPSYKVFVESFFAFAKLFEEIPEFMEASYDNILGAYNTWADPEPQILNLTMCDSKYGLFAVGDVIRGINYGGLGKITEIISSEDSSMVSTALYTITDDVGGTQRRYLEKNMNVNGRYQDMVIELKPIPTKEAKGVESFTPQDSIREQEIRGYEGKGDEKRPNYMTKGADTFQLKGSDAQFGTQSERKVGQNNLRRYPKYGTVSMQKLAKPIEAVPPNFSSLQIGQIFPVWSEFFEYIEGFVTSIKGYTATAGKFIQDIIDTLEGMIHDLEQMIKTIEKFLKFFEVDLSAAGIYALHIESQNEGTDGLARLLTTSSGLPSNLGYAAGILFCGVEIGGLNAIDKLAPLLMGGDGDQTGRIVSGYDLT